jgi:quaternary ammonium compound-resistance protein SugE
MCAAGGSDGGGLVTWFLIVLAGIFETGFAILLKLSNHFTELWPTVGFALCALISFGLLSFAVTRLEIGAAYAVWTGIGAAGTAAVGIFALNESASPLKIISIGLVVAGVVGLNISGVTR